MECFFDTQNWLNSKRRELKGISAFKIIRMYVLSDFCLISFTMTLIKSKQHQLIFFLKRKIKIKSNLLNEAELCITDSNIHLTIAQ